jgi:hypothetical protein
MTRATRAGLIKFAVLAGAADSATAGIATAAKDGTAITENDVIIACVELAQTTNDKTDRTAASAIIAGGKITVPNSASDVILVWWMARDTGLQVASPMVLAGDGDGASAATAIAVTGISTTDVLICSVSIHTTTGAWTDQTDKTTITDDDEIKIATNDTSGQRIFAMWMDLSGPRGFSAMNLQFGLANVDASGDVHPSTASLSDVKAEDVPLVVLVLDETDGDLLGELAYYTTVSADGALEIDDESITDPSPVDMAGADLLVFYQKSNDLD